MINAHWFLQLVFWIAQYTYTHSHLSTIYHSMLICEKKKSPHVFVDAKKKCENERFILLFSVSLVNILYEWKRNTGNEWAKASESYFLEICNEIEATWIVCVQYVYHWFYCTWKPSRKSWLVHFYVYEKWKVGKGFIFYGICISFNG